MTSLNPMPFNPLEPAFLDLLDKEPEIWGTGAADVNPKTIEGKKKPQLHLVPMRPLRLIAVAFQEGARKYGPFNWRQKAVPASTYVSACLRHIQAWFDGEDYDPEETDKHHLAAAAACIYIILDAWLFGSLIDDRPPSGQHGPNLTTNAQGITGYSEDGRFGVPITTQHIEQ